jgi:hypothetical protein
MSSWGDEHEREKELKKQTKKRMRMEQKYVKQTRKTTTLWYIHTVLGMKKINSVGDKEDSAQFILDFNFHELDRSL